jgi:GNAT superfamily N-acetyltransferase
VSLLRMSSDEYQDFLDWSIPYYARANVAAGGWRESDANERARAEYAKVLPNGLDTPGQFLMAVRDESGNRVGEVWFALQKQEGWAQVFIFWIGVREPYRRKGYASQVFDFIEGEAKRLGAGRVALQVFGDNTAARTLYEQLGYVAANIIMTKRI